MADTNNKQPMLPFQTDIVSKLRGLLETLSNLSTLHTENLALPTEILEHALLDKNTQTGSEILSALSALALNPHVAPHVIRLFRPFLIDIAARWLLFDQDPILNQPY